MWLYIILGVVFLVILVIGWGAFAICKEIDSDNRNWVALKNLERWKEQGKK